VTDKIVVLVTCGSKNEARRIAEALVERRLAACVQEMGGSVRSTYRWKGKIESAREFLLVIKTARKRFSAVSKLVKELHSYEVPEIIALNVADGSREYLKWIADSLAASPRAPRR
jgi:periplasmic divalent cation tolerance protein